MSEEFLEVVGIEVGEFSPDLEAVLIVLSAHQVHGHVFDDGHILGAGTGSEAGEVVMEDDIEDLRWSRKFGQGVKLIPT